MTRLLKWIGYPLFAIFAFLVALYITFPFDKIKTRVEDFASASGDMDLRIGEMGPSPLTGVTAQDVVVRFKEKPAPGGMAPAATMASDDGKGKGKGKGNRPAYSRLVLDEVSVSVGILALIAGGMDIGFSVEGLGGTLEGDFETKKTRDWALAAEAKDLKLGQMKVLAKKAGLPFGGGLSIKVNMKVPKGKLNEASGEIELKCDKCSVGDGKKKLKVKGHPFLAAGITLPKLRLGRMGGIIAVEKGVAKIQNFSAKSPDLELKLEGNINLRPNLGFSVLNGYLRFKVSAQMKEKNPAFGLLDSALGSAKRPDGFFGMKVFGSLKNPKFLPSRVGPPKRSSMDREAPSGEKLALAR